MRWQIWIDSGGTFTDCLACDPRTGAIREAKVLSSPQAPIDGIRALLGLGESEPVPPCDVRLGTTIATNALLERRGARVALAITAGFADALEIGTQARPAIFAIDIQKPHVLYERVIEVDARVSATGEILARPDPRKVAEKLAAAREAGIDSLAITILNSHRDDSLEHDVADIGRAVGFAQVSRSAAIARQLGLVARGDTCVIDAYLAPLLRDYLASLAAKLPGSTLRLMQSSGGLTSGARLVGPAAILSGPAGGVVAARQVAREAGFARALAFDMGGTSTDVSRVAEDYERVYETEVAGVRLAAPMLAIHTIAAGGGSICRFRGSRLVVGPESAGSNPGPLCYGRADAEDLTLTDVALLLGRVVADRFPFPLEGERAGRALRDIAGEVSRQTGIVLTEDAIARGFLDIAVHHMAEAIRKVSIARGHDPRDHALVVFGGAGGQFAGLVARVLGIRTLIFDRFAGVLSAYGIGLAPLAYNDEVALPSLPVDDGLGAAIAPHCRTLADQGERALLAEGARPEDVHLDYRLDLRYAGADAALTLSLAEAGLGITAPFAAHESERLGPALAAAFHQRHEAAFGFSRPDRPIEATVLRAETTARHGDATGVTAASQISSHPPAPAPRRQTQLHTGDGFESVPVYHREDLAPGCRVAGPALILDATQTLVVDPGFVAEVQAGARILLRDTARPERASASAERTAVDPARIEVFNNLFMSIAEQMGADLRRAAVSTNIRERLDFSCAVFDHRGDLIANAPHIPVHLGAMAESVKAAILSHPAMRPGSAFATNDPAMGGSHLPDVTVLAPIFDETGVLRFFTAARGHHADIGGITPGSMPADSRALDEEGVVFRAMPIVVGGRLDEAGILAALSAGPHPARSPRDNLADIVAQLAACKTGEKLLARAWADHGIDVLAAYAGHVQDNAAAHVAAEIARLDDRRYEFADSLDDGSPIRVAITVAGERMHIDFAGTGPEHPGNLNAPRAVTTAAVIYVLRCLCDAPIPLNSGCLRPVTIELPERSLLSPGPDRAVCGGNVETSQRIVDVLFGALGIAAASQGTMNNLTFGAGDFGYYETLAGGAGATARQRGASAVHTHMTNTRMTDPEVLEARFPVRATELAIRRGSGGRGAHAGGDGLIRELEFLAPVRVSILSERRTRAPFGLEGGEPGAVGKNLLNGRDVGGRASFEASRGDRIRIETPGGGGFGAIDK